jgi:hypothetical protein
VFSDRQHFAEPPVITLDQFRKMGYGSRSRPQNVERIGSFAILFR